MQTESDRLGLPPALRITVLAGLSASFGLFHGIGKGAKLSSLRYLAENAHRLPRTKGTWYFFHKRKNYVILKDGVNRGVITGLKYGLATALFFGVESLVDWERQTLSWVSTVSAALGTGLAISSWQMLPPKQLLRSVRNFALVGGFVGLVQDRLREKSQASREARIKQHKLKAMKDTTTDNVSA